MRPIVSENTRDGCKALEKPVAMLETSLLGRSIIGIDLAGMNYSIGGDIAINLSMMCKSNRVLCRWHGDPATTRPVQPRTVSTVGPNQGGADDLDLDEDPPQINFPETTMMPNGINNSVSHDRPHANLQNPISYINPQTTLREPVIQHSSTSPIVGASTSGHQNGSTNPLPTPSIAPSSSDPVAVNFTIPQGMLSAYMQYLQVQTQTGKMKLEYMRRREEREEKESAHRRELERMRLERETADYEHKKQKAVQDETTKRALSLLENPNLEEGIRKAAGEYLKSLFEAK
ncbi:hypothetical protein C0993_001291 [Termitomyces sp. T159_Od127]|nr:hypothetical protein C0993_001291 [Termitomyces sp. T159_Od127]